MKTLFTLSVLLLVLSIPKCENGAISHQVALQLEDLQGLHYPLTVKRFYKENQSRPIWVESSEKPNKTWESMLLLDCVVQFGLSHEDYHPEKLLYPELREIVSNSNKITPKKKALFEIFLTDAMITFINDLHFGKANPSLSRTTIDRGGDLGFSAERILTNALNSKDLMSTILDVQPKSQAYVELQKYMTLIRGQYLDDCYTVPEAEARKVAINMERAKWNAIEATNYIEVNIPSYTLIFHQPDTSFTFKIAVGKAEKPTPILRSEITYINTAPDWKVPHDIFVNDILPKALKDIAFLEDGHYTIYDKAGKLVAIDGKMLQKINSDPKSFFARQSASCERSLGRFAFHFPNRYDIYLLDGQQKELFNKEERALTNGCISVDNAEALAALILKNDGQQVLNNDFIAAAGNYKSMNFILKRPLPLMISYQTCEIKKGMLVTYPDPYDKDTALERTIYKHDIMLVKIKTKKE